MTLNTLQRSPLKEMISGVVMVSPVLSWEAALRANARHQRLPRILGSLLAIFLSSELSRIASLDRPVGVRAADNARLRGQVDVPILILHNRNDWSVPFETSAQFAAAHTGSVELIEFDCLGHTQEWNSDPVGWDLAVRRWYGKLFQPDRFRDPAVTDG